MITREEIRERYPEIYEAYSLQTGYTVELCDERLRFWGTSGINCFERWVVPYFFRSESKGKRPCLRLNYPSDGRCSECTKGNCRYDKICFMCGGEGHGAFQTFPGTLFN